MTCVLDQQEPPSWTKWNHKLSYQTLSLGEWKTPSCGRDVQVAGLKLKWLKDCVVPLTVFLQRSGQKKPSSSSSSSSSSSGRQESASITSATPGHARTNKRDKIDLQITVWIICCTDLIWVANQPRPQPDPRLSAVSSAALTFPQRRVASLPWGGDRTQTWQPKRLWTLEIFTEIIFD